MKVLSVNISEKKGTIKLPVDFIELDENGIKNDSHSGKWHRQVSILGIESINKFADILNRTINPGEFAENITLEDLKPGQAKVLDRFSNGEMVLEVTQIGKKCHGTNCAIFRESGDCVMPKEGIFCRVIRGGVLHAGDTVEYLPKTINIHVITLSDRAAAGIYEDRSGPQLLKILTDFFAASGRRVSSGYSLISDDARAGAVIEVMVRLDHLRHTFAGNK
jgi:MOSC domain-containing protein YiiM